MNAHPPGTDAHYPTIAGYRIKGILGRGGMGVVYRAVDTRLHRDVAVKCLPDGGDRRVLQRFVEEAQVISQLRHPNIAQLFDFDADHHPAYYVMELIDGGTLDDLIREKALSPRMASEIVETLAAAMHVAHQAGVLHRDLKPSNILISQSSNVAELQMNQLRIADFGLAKRIESDSKLTKTGEILGTPGYMSPEQATGIVSKLGPATDVYSLGAVLYELVTRRPPFLSDEPVQTLMMLLSDDPVPPRVLNRSIPVDLQTICLKCLEKRPQARYATALALAEDLRRFLNGEPIHAKPISRPGRVLKWVRRRPWPATALASLILTAVGSATGLWIVSRTKHELDQTNQKLQVANASLTTALAESEQSYQLSQEVLNRIVHQIRDELYDIPKAESITLQAVRNSVDLQQRLLKIRPRDRETARQLISALNICRLTEWNQGKSQESQLTTATLKQVISEFTSLYPQESFFQLEALRLSLSELDQMPIDGQPKVLEEVQRTLDRMLKEDPHNYEALQLGGTLEQQWIALAAAKGELVTAVQHSAKRVEYARASVQWAKSPDQAAARGWLLQALIAYSELLLASKDVKTANEVIEEASVVLQQLASDGTASQNIQSQMARVSEILGLAAQSDSRLDAALVNYNKAADILRELVTNFPAERTYRTSLVQVRVRTIACLIQLKRVDECRSIVEEVEERINDATKLMPDDFMLQHLQQQLELLKQML